MRSNHGDNIIGAAGINTGDNLQFNELDKRECLKESHKMCDAITLCSTNTHTLYSRYVN